MSTQLGGDNVELLQKPYFAAINEDKTTALLVVHHESTAANSDEMNGADDNFVASDNNTSTKEYKTTPWRWLILTSLSMCTIC